MKSLLSTIIVLFSLLFISSTAFSKGADGAPSDSYEMNVNGMTCPFCVYGIEKKLNKLAHVKKARVSLKQKKVQIEMEHGQIFNEDEVRKVITDSGFTPGKLL